MIAKSGYVAEYGEAVEKETQILLERRSKRNQKNSNG
jgi:hypothetical protein